MEVTNAPRHSSWRQRWAADPRWARALPPAAILAATFVAYIPALALGFVFDDHALIANNDSIRSWRYLPAYFTSHIWGFLYPHLLSNAYRPLYLVWLRLNDGLFGRHVWGWHLSLLIAHLAVTYLVYRLCLAITGNVWSGAAAALIFGLHPVHVETVAEAAWADQPLSTLFILAAVLAFLRSRRPARRRGWMIASLGFTAATLLLKESGMLLPVLVAGADWLYGGSSGREAALIECGAEFPRRLGSALSASIPYWTVTLAYVLLRVRVLKGFSHVVTPLPLSSEILTLPSVLLFYLRLLVWPLGLSCYYDTPYISSAGWSDFILPAAVLAAVAAALALWYRWTRRAAPSEAKAIAFGSLWMVLTLLPVLNFRFFPFGEIAHDRYVYLASVGFVILAATALRQLTAAGARVFSTAAWALPAALVVSAGLAYGTSRQCLFWSDDLTLNYRAHQIAPLNVSATTGLAAAVAQRGMVGPAMELYQQALAIRPQFWRANVNLAYLYYEQGNYPESARFFVRACAADPTDGDQFLFLGMALLHQGKLSEAEKAVRTALIVRPLGKRYHLGLGMVLKAEGSFEEARREVESELSRDPGDAQARGLLNDLNSKMATGKAATIVH